MRKLLFILVVLYGVASPLKGLMGQEANTNVLTPEELTRYKAKVEDLVRYFEGTLNFLGDPKSVTKEKEIAINESYLKIFKDDKVQIEDDLDESREVPLHKDVQAYLKDIEFFFRTVKFNFVVSDITFNAGENDMNYFKVTLNRDISGITVTGDTVSNRKVRFMEINLDIADSDLRIASLYTTKLNEKEERRNWWNGLPEAWRTYFGERVSVYDSLRLADVYYIADSMVLISRDRMDGIADTARYFNVEMPAERQSSLNDHQFDSLYVNTAQVFNKLSGILKQTSVDISGNEQIRSLEPLAELSDLTDLNCSNTFVTSLFPLRNLNRLLTLDVSNTPVDDLSPLQYSTSLKKVNCSYTLLDNLEPLSGLYNLEKLSCAGLRISDPGFVKDMANLQDLNLNGTNIHDLTMLSGIITLEELDVSGTGIRSLDKIASLTRLKFLNAEGTSVSKVDPISGLKQLEVLKISYTAIEDLNPLYGLQNLKRIYWDSNGDFSVDKKKKRAQAIAFMNTHPGSLVIFESEELLNGWADLEDPWKRIARNAASLSENPTKEELHALLQLEEVVIDSTPVTTLNPVAQLYNLKRLSVPGLQVKDYNPIGEAIELEYLDLSGTAVPSLEFAASLNHLKELHIDGTAVTDIAPLNGLKELMVIYADNSGIDDADVIHFKSSNPGCLIIYKTAVLVSWWATLPDAWKAFFVAGFTLDSPPSKEQLHQLYYLETLTIENNANIRSFEPVKQLEYLKHIHFSELGTGDLSFVGALKGLRELECTRMPVTNLASLSFLENLDLLNLENTPVEDLKPIGSLKSLKHLNVSGTQIKSLKAVSDLVNLESIELNNTQVKSISPLFSMPSLKSVSCFNTRVASKNIDKFKEEKPDCKVVYY